MLGVKAKKVAKIASGSKGKAVRLLFRRVGCPHPALRNEINVDGGGFKLPLRYRRGFPFDSLSNVSSFPTPTFMIEPKFKPGVFTHSRLV